MTTPTAGHVRLIMGGNIGSTQTWSTGISVATTDTIGVGPLSALLAAFRDAVQANLWGSSTTGPLRQINFPGIDLRLFRAYWYPSGGPPAVLQAALDITPLPGTGSGVIHPTQVCIVASLLTGVPGRAYRGRMYLPATAQALASDGQVAAGALTSLANGVALTIGAVNAYTTTDGPGDVVVAGSAGNTKVSSVKVDSELDIQRRRADKILALRQVTTVIA